MLTWAALIASLAFVVFVVATIPVLLQILRTARAAEHTLVAAEREVRPLATQMQALLQEHRDLAQQATRDLRRFEALAQQGQEVLRGVTRFTGVLGSLGTVGKVIGIAQGFRKGVDVFIRRLSRRRGT